MSARTQRGVVLITVLLIVVLATVSAVAMLERTQIAAARSANLRAADQAYLHALAVEDQARRVLARSGDQVPDALAVRVPGMAGGAIEVQAAIEDLQARFNLNNLVRDGAASEPDVVYFVRLLTSLGLDPGLADAVVDWIDPDGTPRAARGAEDGTYLERDPPHLAANRAMLSTSELRLLPGFSAEAVARLAPHVAALPEPTPINVNSAGPEVLASLAEGLDARTLAPLIAQRRVAGFDSVQQFLADPALRGRALSAAALTVRSGYFRLRAQVGTARGQVHLLSVLRRDDDGRIDVLMRSRGGE